MSPGFTHTATDRLAQLAHNAFEEEQYDLGVQSLSQLASLGWHPTSGLVRSLLVLSLCSLPDASSHRSSQAKGSQKKSSSLHRSIETSIAPTAECIIDASQLLEHICEVAAPDVIFDAIRSPLSSPKDYNSGTPEMTRKRSRGSAEQRPSDDEDDSLLEPLKKDSFARSLHISPLTKYVIRLKRCENVWQILALGDMMETSSKNKKSRSDTSKTDARHTSTQSREGEESVLCNSAFDREPVWRVLDIFVQCWEKERRTTARATSRMDTRALHLAHQFQDPAGRAGGRGRPGQATDLSEAFEVIYAGLAPTSLLRREVERSLSMKKRLQERHRRGSVAAKLLVELFHLPFLGVLDRQATLRGTAALLQKGDTLAKRLICDALQREGFDVELGEAAMMCLLSNASEDTEEVNSSNGRIYAKLIERIGSSLDVDAKTNGFFNALGDPSWILVREDGNGECASNIELLWEGSSHEIAVLQSQAHVKALLAGPWSIRAGARKGTSPSNASLVAAMSRKHLAFAAAWRRASIQVLAGHFVLRAEIVAILKRLARAVTGETLLKQLADLCGSILISQGQYLVERIKACHGQMSLLTKQQGKTDIDAGLEEKVHQKAVQESVAVCEAHCVHIANITHALEFGARLSGKTFPTMSPAKERGSSEEQDQVDDRV